MKITATHVYFWGGIYSNFHLCDFTVSGVKYNSSEQYFMAMKAVRFNDVIAFNKIMRTSDPVSQKAAGRGIKGFDSNVWDATREEVMFDGVLAKFLQNNHLRQQLLSAGDRCFVEASPYDRIWGVGLHEDDPLILDSKNWRGQNLLGKTLNKVREQLKGLRYDNRMEK